MKTTRLRAYTAALQVCEYAGFQLSYVRSDMNVAIRNVAALMQAHPIGGSPALVWISEALC